MSMRAYYAKSSGAFVLVCTSFCLTLLSAFSTQPSDRSALLKKYEPVIAALSEWLPREIADKGIPALSIALVDDQTLVWEAGFGFQDPEAKSAAGPRTVYRVGSVSKPITALLLMMLVESGAISLDAPVERYLAEFKPTNQFGKPITLRQILAHRSGLVRETPVGSYFDDTEPTLAQTVASLNKTELVYAPETKTSYSNAALATVGLLLEKTQNVGFARLIKQRLLDPIGMTDSSFVATPAIRKNLARAIMWTYHGTTFPAPTWELGMPSAGNLYSTVHDQAKLLSFLFAGGKTPTGKQLLKKETLESMWKIQYPEKEQKAGFGLSFFVSEFDSCRRIGHGGAVYGFATDLSALPDEKLGVVVIASKDVANAVTKRVADVALRQLLAIRSGKPPPPIAKVEAIAPATARALEGLYRSEKKEIELQEFAGKLYIWPHKDGTRVELRKRGDEYIGADAVSLGPRFHVQNGDIAIGKDIYKRALMPTPEPLPEKWRGLIGEYGPDHNILYILEKNGQLHALIEWVFLYPLEEIRPDVYKFPDFGLYHGDKVIFRRDKAGRGVVAEAATVPFKRRTIKGENATFKIDPVRNVAALRQAALAAKPPEEKNAFFKKPELVELTALDPSIKLDIRYATDNNFLGTPVYTTAKAYLQKPAAEALVRAHKGLAKTGHGLLIHDAYRPWHITKVFRDATPEKFHLFVADPQQGSRHNRGCAVDLTLFDLKTGRAVDMVSGYDEFSDRSYANYLGGTSLQRWRRLLLRRAMEAEGFTVYDAEWWHFDYRDWRQYPIMNQAFEDLK